MMNTEQLKQEIANLELALEELRDRADADLRITHNKFNPVHWMQAMDPLEIRLITQRALLKRIETVGR